MVCHVDYLLNSLAIAPTGSLAQRCVHVDVIWTVCVCVCVCAVWDIFLHRVQRCDRKTSQRSWRPGVSQFHRCTAPVRSQGERTPAGPPPLLALKPPYRTSSTLGCPLPAPQLLAKVRWEPLSACLGGGESLQCYKSLQRSHLTQLCETQTTLAHLRARRRKAARPFGF